MWKDVAGTHVREDAPGLKKIRIEPHVNWKLRYVQAEYDSVCGRIKVMWELPDIDHVHIRVSVPAACEAGIKLPFYEGEEVVLAGGEFETTYQTAIPVVKRYSIEEDLRKLLARADTRRVLKEQLRDLDHITSVGMDHPLRETLQNLNYEDAFIEDLSGKLSNAFEEDLPDNGIVIFTS